MSDTQSEACNEKGITAIINKGVCVDYCTQFNPILNAANYGKCIDNLDCEYLIDTFGVGAIFKTECKDVAGTMKQKCSAGQISSDYVMGYCDT